MTLTTRRIAATLVWLPVHVVLYAIVWKTVLDAPVTEWLYVLVDLADPRREAAVVALIKTAIIGGSFYPFYWIWFDYGKAPGAGVIDPDDAVVEEDSAVDDFVEIQEACEADGALRDSFMGEWAAESPIDTRQDDCFVVIAERERRVQNWKRAITLLGLVVTAMLCLLMDLPWGVATFYVVMSFPLLIYCGQQIGIRAVGTRY